MPFFYKSGASGIDPAMRIGRSYEYSSLYQFGITTVCSMTPEPLIPPHGGYRVLKSYQMAEIVHDATVAFCGRFIDRRSRTNDQMVQAARSGKQNIAEGSAASATSRKTELKLVGVARASLEELLIDFHDYLRQHKLALWPKEYAAAKEIRALAYRTDRTYKTYRTYFETATAEVAANAAICLIHQANSLLDRQLRALEEGFVQEGGFTERLHRVRSAARGPWKKQ
jgi:restriction system protein